MSGAKKEIGVKRDVEFDAGPKAGEVLAHGGTKGLDFLFAAFLQGFIKGLGVRIEAYGRQRA
jgi:hypothetical protein